MYSQPILNTQQIYQLATFVAYQEAISYRIGSGSSGWLPHHCLIGIIVNEGWGRFRPQVPHLSFPDICCIVAGMLNEVCCALKLNSECLMPN
jgi:hypothetical protein